MAINKFFGTKKIGRCGSSQTIIFDCDWKFKRDELVEITIRRADFSDKPMVSTKKVCKIGSSLGIYCCKGWGYDFNEMVTFVIRPRNPGNDGPIDEVILDDIGDQD